MVSPNVMVKAAELLFKMENKKMLQEVLAGNQATITEILTPMTKGKISGRDMRDFSAMVEACTRTATGAEEMSVNPATLAAALTGNGWVIALRAAGALLKNGGETVANILENRGNSLAETFKKTRSWKSERQLQDYGLNPIDRHNEAAADLYKARQEQRAALVKGITSAISDAIGAGTGAYQMGKMLDIGRNNDIGGEVYKTARRVMDAGGKI